MSETDDEKAHAARPDRDEERLTEVCLQGQAFDPRVPQITRDAPRPPAAVSEVAMPPQQAFPPCPPHRWLIESRYQTGGTFETWTCGHCGEVRHADRRALDAQLPRFTSRAGTKPPPRTE